MTTYVCNELATRPDIYGQFACKQWVIQENWLDSLAITSTQAGQISVAICGCLVLGWILGELGSLMKNMVK